jgi:hypothetical protein
MAILRIEAINKGVWQYHHVPFSLLVAPVLKQLIKEFGNTTMFLSLY